jgi:hypothetical protein
MKSLMNRLPGAVVPPSILVLFGGFWPLFQKQFLQLFVDFGHLIAAHSWDHHHGPHSLSESFKPHETVSFPGII